jgi:hypothetical protein
MRKSPALARARPLPPPAPPVEEGIDGPALEELLKKVIRLSKTWNPKHTGEPRKELPRDPKDAAEKVPVPSVALLRRICRSDGGSPGPPSPVASGATGRLPREVPKRRSPLDS